MTPANIKKAAPLIEALEELPKVQKRLNDKPSKYHDSIALELSAADMSDGEGQGSEAYIYLPVEIGQEVLAFAETILRAKLEALGVKP